MTTITIWGTSDIHGFLPTSLGLEPTDISAASHGSAGILSGAAIRHAHGSEHTLLIDAGDYYFGSPYATFAHCVRANDTQTTQPAQTDGGSAFLSPLTKSALICGYDAMAPGNHDFDHGVGVLRAQQPFLGEKLVCCNVFDLSGTRIFPAYRILELADVSVAVIGAVTGALPQLTAFANTADIIVDDAVQCIADAVHEVRKQVDLVILAYHGGIERDMADGRPTQYDTGEDQAYRILDSIQGIDGMICGHQHRTAYGESHGALYVQPGYQGEFVGAMRFELEADHSIRSHSASLFDTTALDPEHALDVQSNLALREAFNLPRYRRWLEGPIDVSHFAQYVTDKTGIRSYRYTWRDGCCKPFETARSTSPRISVETFKRSFPSPYALSVFRLTEEEYQALAERDIIAWSGSQHPRPETLGGYRVITNDPQAFPAYRLERCSVDNVFDEYIAQVADSTRYAA